MKKTILCSLLVVLLVCLSNFSILAQTTEFAFDGSIEGSGFSKNGDYEFEFKIFDEETGGVQQGPTLSFPSVPVDKDFFSVLLDFGAGVFPGDDRWVEIGLRTIGDPGPFTNLAPRAKVFSVPYSQRAISAATADSAIDLGGLTEGDFIQNTITPQPGANFNISGDGNIGGTLSVSGPLNLGTLGSAGSAFLCRNVSNIVADCIGAGGFVADDDPRLTDARNPLVGSPNYIQNTTTQQVASNFNISGSGKATVFDAATQYDIGGNRVLSFTGTNFFAGPGAGLSNTTGNLNSFFGSDAGRFNTTGDGNSFFGRSAGFNNTIGIRNSFFGQGAGFFNASGVGNSFYGYEAGQHNSTGTDNSFFGLNAGISNTTGNFNSFFGTRAGSHNTTANRNSFFGNQAGNLNTTGTSNSFFGSNAGEANTTGGRNSFVGNWAGNKNTTGSFNSIFGFQAGISNTTGDKNSFFGADAGSQNETGSENSFFGLVAGFFNTTGNFNSFFGTRAGSQNTTGSQNSAFGKWAGIQNKTGFDNSSFGSGAGYFNTTGSENSFFGANAGELSATGSNNTFIGSRTSVSLPDLTYATAIGSRAIVSASNTIQLGRNTLDTVRIGKLGTAGTTALCQNASAEISVCSSSIRYKTNINDFRPGLELIRKLRPVSFSWKQGGMPDVGLVAEEVEKVEPLLTTTNSKGEIEGVKYDRVGVVLVNAVKEQQEQIEEQRETAKEQDKRIEALQNQVDEQKEIIKKQQSEIDTLKALVCGNNKEAQICNSKHAPPRR